VTPAPQTDVFVVPLEPQVPQTGDDTSFVLWTGALAALIACLVSVLKKAAR
jgi:LPXTG-motif cell wall-anchored protein